MPATSHSRHHLLAFSIQRLSCSYLPELHTRLLSGKYLSKYSLHIRFSSRKYLSQYSHYIYFVAPRSNLQPGHVSPSSACLERAPPTVISDRYDLVADLPQGYQLQSYSTLKELKNAVKAIHNQLEKNNGQGNQWLLINGISRTTIERLSNDHSCLSGIEFRFMWIGTTGLLKVVPSIEHDLTTSDVDHYIDRQCVRMGVPDNELVWGYTVTTPGTITTHGKEPDDCFYPPNRQPLAGQFNGWPSLVIETGVSESLAKLRRDATWWLQNSSGDTRIVLVISIKKAMREIRFEKWQLVPPNFPRPVTRQAVDQLRQQPNQMPPLVQQQANSQIAFCIQEVIITPTSITGEPLVIPFRAMFDRQPTGTEGDIVINHQGFRTIARFV
ncbi:hypothetical protein ABOM_011522 [Aspergillus bombycis]|uniref:Uncharacterized protein n=1 Tax=Aspergillus bombycis TaxID=109264 RepID=A0A1F7ZJP7_9EURO|nr:hypothetical protein ABOM_011522 [Aspergillus bombycis]OGM39664.1 hypothetical protein ABOM_011522 [Aspergillus bombycis]